MPALTFHLIANAHLDPVWLWDWREGLNEGLVTCRTILDLMDEDPELTFVRGEAAVYDHIERNDPATFERIRRQVDAGRWDVVGGTWIQPDTNLPATETFARHFARGQRYFRERFGRPVRVAWAADSFGHAAGLPEIFAQAGIRGFAFTRPNIYQLRMPKAAFWWEGPGGSRVMGYRPPMGWYGCERDEVPRLLDAYLREAQAGDLENVGFFYGMGDHGGGPTRRMVRDIRAWAAAHPEVRFVHSGLHRLFDALYDEVRRKGEDLLPVHRGEMNYCLRGCYASVLKLKGLYRRAEAAVGRAETTVAAVRAATGAEAPPLDAAWDAVLFNSFHDILPGTSIERAYDDQLTHLGGAIHDAQRAELAALNALAGRVDTRVRKAPADHPTAAAMLAWNPHPYPFAGFVELETNMDYRPLWPYRGRADEVPLRVLGPSGRPLPFQAIAVENQCSPQYAWRKRVLVPVTLPALGWNVLEFGWVEGAAPPPPPPEPATAPRDGVIDNGRFRVEAAAGDAGVRILRGRRAWLAGAGLQAAVFDDPFGSWGGMQEEPESFRFGEPRERWTVREVHTLERGPHRATLWVRLAGKRSRIDLTISLCAGRDAIDVAARVLWDERNARLKLVLPAGEEAQFEVPGGSVRRGPAGEVPGGRWVRVFGKNGPALGFASDALYSFDASGGALRPTVCRASRYAAETKADPDVPWRPAVDAGELKFRFLLSPGGEDLPRLAEQLERPPVVLLVPASEGPLPRRGSLAELKPAGLKLLALVPQPDGRGALLRVQNTGDRTVVPRLAWQGEKLALAKLPAGRIGCWRLARTRRGWRATATDLTGA